MPKRSNDFQKLVYLVRVNLADGAKVTESKLLRDRQTKTLREVDVCIEGNVGGETVLVSIECRDHKRVADVGWVEAMKTKHERLPTNALFLASRSGFTKEARAVADLYGIRTFTLEDVETENFPALIGEESALWLKTFEVSAERVKVSMPAVLGLPDETIGVKSDNLVYLGDGFDAGPIGKVVEALLQSPAYVQKMNEQGTAESKWFDLLWKDPRNTIGQPIFLKKLEPLVLREIVGIRVEGPCKLEIAKFGVRRGKLGNVHIAWGKANLPSGNAIFIATKDEAGAEKVTMNFEGKPR